MVSFYGDYDLTETVNIPFNTFSSDDPSASVTVTDLANGDVYVHQDGVEGTPTGITVSLNVGSVNGNHLAILDLTDTNDPGFYANGSRYQVRMEGVTIDGATVNAWIGSFSIGCTLRPATAGRTLVVESDGVAHADVKEWLGVAPLALSSQQVQAIVPNTQKVDVETIKTQAVTCGAGVIVGVYVGSTAAAAVASDVTTAHSTTDGLVNGLNDFDPANDAVASVTLVDTTTAVTNEVTADMTKISGGSTEADRLQAALGTGNYIAADCTLIEGGDATDAIQAAADAALVANNLDHLLKVADNDDVVDNSVIAKLATKGGDWSTRSTNYSHEGLYEYIGQTYTGVYTLLQDVDAEAVAIRQNTDKMGFTGSDPYYLKTDVTLWKTATAPAAPPTKAEMDTAHGLLATPAQVNAQVLDVLAVDTLVANQTIVEALRRIGARAAGEISGAGTGTETVIDWAASANTIVYTVDEDGNISAVTFN